MKYIFSLLLFIGILNAAGVKPVNNELYINECASCHFGYQPGLLPSKSWDKVMNNLSNHFGTDASLDQEDFDKIYKYIMENSAEKAMNYKRSRRIVNSLASYTQDINSITKVPYIIRKHREIPKRLITQDKVKTLSNCTACHTTAKKGIYSERDIRIPGYGRWDD
ncbi:hypothetical protein GCM10012288_19350 [Malaciobacter pacificus]|uniref:Diheme cytochrome c n=1 Tax=Malaciobacter pacificus TaxID=1080223 RepID=A0A5C2HGY6_9BACT|nr:diheme cytochrome c [Malaciobacter pacificus]QEP35652.1 diheme cytochrome c [Malaciobacter pacificus]GGD45139.1 hypothetical protein GCM10012288_19350 [Malaciobacter pacificus]